MNRTRWTADRHVCAQRVWAAMEDQEQISENAQRDVRHRFLFPQSYVRAGRHFPGLSALFKSLTAPCLLPCGNAVRRVAKQMQRTQGEYRKAAMEKEGHGEELLVLSVAVASEFFHSTTF
ncbi:hypothetical protein NDU88_003989 [Pleurodeles waltl]|uniref:Uncharacterized protein n=1 Tax=Pleurodeles waltl TaxID=8319 RepID=A0AAV7UE32_PLEWA|nr:hypothetical protein NDU88_003989 [Pleurodeles waltl]